MSLLCAFAVLAPTAVVGHDAPAGAVAAKTKAKSKRCKPGFVRSHGHCGCPKGKVRKGSKCVRTPKKKAPAKKPTTQTTPKPSTTPTTTTTTTTPAPAPPTDGPPFAPPGHDLTGNPAAQAILPFLANSTFTSCVAGWPNCSVEERYGHFADGSFYYCRLTPSSGSDIINAAHPFTIIGADQKADGSWAVTLQVFSYGNALTYYTWTVATNGATTGLYWGPGSNPQTNAPTQQITGLQWVRGARNCSY